MRSTVIATIAGALFLLSAAQANAVTEFCPASLSIKAVGANMQDQPATLYGIMLRAFGPRSVTATLAFDTDKGWFAATVSPVTLSEKQYHYTTGHRTAVRSDWVSPVMYVKFPSALRVTNSWVSNANAVRCFPSPPSPKGPTVPRPVGLLEYILDPQDEDQISVSPTVSSVVISAQNIAPLYQATCANPTRFGSVTNHISPEPGDDPAMQGLSGASVVEVALRQDGSLADARVYLSSGEATLDNALLWAAQHSGYENAVAYCEPVPAYYLLKASFQ